LAPPLFIISPNFNGLVYIKGSDAFTFLQNIITNDLTLLDNQAIIHSCLLTPQGKYLHDFYVMKIDDGYVFACEGGKRKDDLVQKLSTYKLRADITLTSKIVVGEEWGEGFHEWDKDRIKKSMPDGSRDAEIGVSTLAELNLDIETVSYTKGCFVGQELVARMHNRNLGKKHLVCVEFFETPPAHGSEIKGFGLMRSSCENLGLILMNREAEENLKQGKITDAPFRLLGL
jgi:folate-binding protein YgfZ